MFHGLHDLASHPLQEVSLTQNLETIKLQDLTTLDLFYLIA